jgi:hypothetical protein
MKRRPYCDEPRKKPHGYSLGEPEEAFIRQIARARFKGNASKALRYLVGRAGEILAGEEAPA